MIADDMKNITENIIASHEDRVRALRDRIVEVNETLAGARKTIAADAANRKTMSKEQAAELSRFAGDLASGVEAKLKGFRKELDLTAKDRASSAGELKARLRAEARGVKNMTRKKLNDYHKNHAEMSEALRNSLHGFTEDIVEAVDDLAASTGNMMKGYRSDVRKAGNIWGNMTRTLAGVEGKPAASAGPKKKAEEKATARKGQAGKKTTARKVQKPKKSKK